MSIASSRKDPSCPVLSFATQLLLCRMEHNILKRAFFLHEFLPQLPTLRAAFFCCCLFFFFFLAGFQSFGGKETDVYLLTLVNRLLTSISVTGTYPIIVSSQI